MKPVPGQKYYDETGVEINDGDLLQVWHFRAAARRQIYYMYKIATVIDGYMYGKALREDHKYGLWSVCDDNGIIHGTKIIDMYDWEKEHERKREAKIRMKMLKNKQHEQL